TEKDSLVFVTSDFNVHWLENNFEPRTENLITSGINSVNQIVPKLNTLPYMLKDIVQFLNEKKTDAEVWLISDDGQTGVRAETVMELLQQTYYAAKHKIIFNIADATSDYRSYYIQNKYYMGNEYLYENLTRLSSGNFNKLYYKYYLNFIDEMLDCWAPKVSTVEIDPLPQTGITYSRINMNNGINNFNITSRYGELGIYEGSAPFDINYYGYYLGGGYFNNINVDEDNTAVSEDMLKNTGLYWYGNYIMQELFLQPQSYSTIKYIEDLSVQNHLLTPYTGFIIPGPSGYSGFNRIYLDQQAVSVKNDDAEKQKILPGEISLDSYPNPFNPATTIVMKLGSSSFNTKKILNIYNILGKQVKTFDLSGYDSAGEIKVVWNGLNDNGETVSSGIYIAVLKTGTQMKSLKLSLIR
ncbi:MAG: FlgD immunoglobulin-like domain containing protein, partial [Ignavibacteria bacterium]